MNECGKGWSNRCAAAKSKACRCKCGGANHGGDYRTRDRNGTNGAEWSVVLDHEDGYVIRDVGHTTGRSITNDLEAVVAKIGPRLGNRRLYYFDSDGRLDEIIFGLRAATSDQPVVVRAGAPERVRFLLGIVV